MAPETVGRKLGIGLRLAAKAVQQKAAEASATSTPPAPAAVRTPQMRVAPAAAQAKVKATGVARGAKRFGEAIWGPMAHTGGVLWLEITGLFFALFALFFAQNVYKYRVAWKAGPDHTHFLIYSGLTILFAAFTFSQFFTAKRKEKRNRARRAAN